jgi:heme/copper-type cytochrome/quinol oxidase subunit 2
VFHITARRYAFDPPRLRVNKGDRVVIYLTSHDVTHGFFLEGYDLDAEISPDEKLKVHHPSRGDDWQEVEAITFVANRVGKFRYRCSHTCGALHPFMQGELVVGPNVPYSLGVVLLLLVAGWTWWRGGSAPSPEGASDEERE